MAQPERQVCPICAYSDDVAVVFVDDEWVMSCSAGHPVFEWRPKAQFQKLTTYRNGLGGELGIYDMLLDCVFDDRFVEYGVVEHRFAEGNPDTYKFLVDRYGHTALGPSKYTASAFIGGALGQLWREQLVAGVWGPATGYWKYNGEVGAYAPAGTDEGDAGPPALSWETFATKTLGLDPTSWPALGFTAEN